MTDIESNTITIINKDNDNDGKCSSLCCFLIIIITLIIIIMAITGELYRK